MIVNGKGLSVYQHLLFVEFYGTNYKTQRKIRSEPGIKKKKKKVRIYESFSQNNNNNNNETKKIKRVIILIRSNVGNNEVLR